MTGILAQCKTLAALLEAGAEEKQRIVDIGDGILVAAVKDTDGNVIGLSRQAT